MDVSKILKLAISVTICQAAGILGAASTSAGGWYDSLAKPFFTPPSWVFGPAWIALYLLMGISLYLVWQTGAESKQKKKAIIVFAVQLALNAAWSPLFFGIRSPAAGLADIALLLPAILMTMLLFWRVERKASLLLLPYLLWTGFALALNLSIVLMN